eukprot:403351254
MNSPSKTNLSDNFDIERFRLNVERIKTQNANQTQMVKELRSEPQSNNEHSFSNHNLTSTFNELKQNGFIEHVKQIDEIETAQTRDPISETQKEELTSIMVATKSQLKSDENPQPQIKTSTPQQLFAVKSQQIDEHKNEQCEIAPPQPKKSIYERMPMFIDKVLYPEFNSNMVRYHREAKVFMKYISEEFKIQDQYEFDPNGLILFPLNKRWLKGEEYGFILRHYKTYNHFGYYNVNYQQQDPEVYERPYNGLVYFIKGFHLREFGFPRLKEDSSGGQRKEFKWKKINFVTDLPKHYPISRYLVAKTKNGDETYFMHSVILRDEYHNDYRRPEILRQLKSKRQKLKDEDINPRKEYERIILCHVFEKEDPNNISPYKPNYNKKTRFRHLNSSQETLSNFSNLKQSVQKFPTKNSLIIRNRESTITKAYTLQEEVKRKSNQVTKTPNTKMKYNIQPKELSFNSNSEQQNQKITSNKLMLQDMNQIVSHLMPEKENESLSNQQLQLHEIKMLDQVNYTGSECKRKVISNIQRQAQQKYNKMEKRSGSQTNSRKNSGDSNVSSNQNQSQKSNNSKNGTRKSSRIQDIHQKQPVFYHNSGEINRKSNTPEAIIGEEQQNKRSYTSQRFSNMDRKINRNGQKKKRFCKQQCKQNKINKISVKKTAIAGNIDNEEKEEIKTQQNVSKRQVESIRGQTLMDQLVYQNRATIQQQNHKILNKSTPQQIYSENYRNLQFPQQRPKDGYQTDNQGYMKRKVQPTSKNFTQIVLEDDISEDEDKIKPNFLNNNENTNNTFYENESQLSDINEDDSFDESTKAQYSKNQINNILDIQNDKLNKWLRYKDQIKETSNQVLKFRLNFKIPYYQKKIRGWRYILNKYHKVSNNGNQAISKENLGQKIDLRNHLPNKREKQQTLQLMQQTFEDQEFQKQYDNQLANQIKDLLSKQHSLYLQHNPILANQPPQQLEFQNDEGFDTFQDQVIENNQHNPFIQGNQQFSLPQQNNQSTVQFRKSINNQQQLVQKYSTLISNPTPSTMKHNFGFNHGGNNQKLLAATLDKIRYTKPIMPQQQQQQQVNPIHINQDAISGYPQRPLNVFAAQLQQQTSSEDVKDEENSQVNETTQHNNNKNISSQFLTYSSKQSNQK